MDKIGFGGDGGVKKTQKTSDIINGCSLKATNSWTPLTKMSTKRYYSASVPVKGKLLVLGGCDGDNSLATSEYVCSSMEMHPSQYDQQTPPSSPYYVLPPITATLEILTEAVLAVLPSTVQCMTTEKLSLQWEDEDQATAEVLDYSQPKSSMDNK